jgi:hypothetical protein
LTLLVAGCSSVKLISDSAVCNGLEPLVDSHVDALLIDGGPQSLVSGERLVSGYDAGCNP